MESDEGNMTCEKDINEECNVAHCEKCEGNPYFCLICAIDYCGSNLGTCTKCSEETILENLYFNIYQSEN